jgi:hypothetical protein
MGLFVKLAIYQIVPFPNFLYIAKITNQYPPKIQPITAWSKVNVTPVVVVHLPKTLQIHKSRSTHNFPQPLDYTRPATNIIGIDS